MTREVAERLIELIETIINKRNEPVIPDTRRASYIHEEIESAKREAIDILVGEYP